MPVSAKQIEENLRKLGEACDKKTVRDMKRFESELHSEIDGHLWFLEKTGWNEEEIHFATLMRIPKEFILKYLEKIQ